jgi:hypothetical protein
MEVSMTVRSWAARVLVLAAWLCAARDAVAQATRTRNVVLIVTDGLRWQEVFHGADSALLDRENGGVRDTASLRKELWRTTPEEARAALLPFFWGVIARQGQVYGNQSKGSVARVTNGLKFSYPGYSEMLTGRPDPRIDSNGAGPNPNVTVFEWLHALPEYRGRVAAFGTWKTFDDIFNEARSGIPVRAGWELPFDDAATPEARLLDSLYSTTTRLWDDVAYDSFMQEVVLGHVRTRRPRVLFVGYGETDEWAHARRYDQYLHSARRVDQFVAQLWRAMQAIPQYRDSTTFIITADHGRGGGRRDWTDHGRDVDGAESIWIAVLGPDTPPLGERSETPRVTQSQIAATAALLGQDYQRAVPSAARPLVEVIAGKR